MSYTKDQIVEEFFETDERAEPQERFVKKGYQVEYNGDIVDCLDGYALYVNQDREGMWEWSQVKVEDLTVYKLVEVELS